MTISGGVASAEIRSAGTTCMPDELILSADAALYRANREEETEWQPRR